MTTLVVVVVVIATVLAIASAMAMRPKPATTDGRAWPGPEMGTDVAAFLAAFVSSPDEEHPAFKDAVAKLRASGAVNAQRIVASYRSVSPENLGPRRLLLYTARYLAHEAALPMLIELATQEPHGNPAHEGSRLSEESMLRSIAVEAIEKIAGNGNQQATEALLNLLRSSDRLVQATAAVALKYLGLPAQSIARHLPADHSFLLDVTRVDVRDVPQIKNPLRHLRAEAPNNASRPALNADAHALARRDAASRAPRVS